MEKLKRHKAFLLRENVERPLIGFWIGSNFPLQRFQGARTLLKEGCLAPEDVDPAAFLEDYERIFSIGESVGDDIVRVAEPFWGIPWMEAILGCPIHASANSIWSEPILDDPGRAEIMEPDEFLSKNRWLRTLVEFTRVVVGQSNGRYPVGMPVLRGPVDMMAALLGSQNLVFACFNNPEPLRNLANFCTRLWIAVATRLLNLIPPFHGGYGASFFNLWAPGECVWFQEDASAFLSPRFYREFILSGDIAISNRFDYSIIHLHSAALYMVEDLLKIESLNVIEINRDPVGPPVSELIPVFRKIQEIKPLLIWGIFSETELVEILDSLSPRGLFLHLVVDSEDEARCLLEVVKCRSSKNTGRI